MAELELVNYSTPNRAYFDNGIWGQLKRVALSQEGQVIGFHHPNDSSQWEDGTAVNWIQYENNGWNCMVQIPKFYYKVQNGSYLGFNDVYRAEVSGTPREGFKLHPTFERTPGDIHDYQYIAAFEGWVDGIGRLRSLPAKPVHRGMPRAWYRAAAQTNENHAQYQIQDFYITSALQMLYLTEYGGFDAQTKIGNVPMINRGTGDSVGYGNRTVAVPSFYAFAYRGIENIFGNIHKFVDGINVNGLNVYIAKKNFADGVYDGEYVHAGNVPTGNGLFISDFHRTQGALDFTYIPSSVSGGGGNKYLSDILSSVSTSNRVASFGGQSNTSNQVTGLFTWDFTLSATDGGTNTGTRLMYL